MKFRFLHRIVLFVTITLSSVTKAQDCQDNWLSTKGNKIVDINGTEVILAGVNWFGLETQNGFPHGIWARDLESVLQQSKDLGFNCFRIPWSNDNLFGNKVVSQGSYGTDPVSGVTPMNVEVGKVNTPIEILDILVEWCQENDMKIILDNHTREQDQYLTEKLWFTPEVSTEQWIADWVALAERYKEYSAVIGMDLNNEPNGTIDNAEGAKWGSGDQYDWRLAAEDCGNAILEVNPNVLILVEGIEAYNRPDGTQTSYWWGGNLQGAREYPVRLSDPSKLVYSPHEYGPRVFAQEWFTSSDFPDNMVGIWEEQFNFLNSSGTSPLLIGELGIQSEGGLDEIWFQEFINFIRDQKLHYTFWALNPNSGDTGGILEDDWFTVVQWKMDYLQEILSDPIPNCIAYTGEPEEPTVVTPVVTTPEPEEPVVIAPVVTPEPEEPTVIAPVVIPEPEEPTVIAPVVISEPEEPTVIAPVVISEPEEPTVIAPVVVTSEPEEPTVVTPVVIPEPEEPVVPNPIVVDIDEIDEEAIIEDSETIKGDSGIVEFNIYPNPTKGVINFTHEIKEFTLYDIHGRFVDSLGTVLVSENGYTYDLSNMSSDIYLARVVTAEGVTLTIKVIKE